MTTFKYEYMASPKGQHIACVQYWIWFSHERQFEHKGVPMMKYGPERCDNCWDDCYQCPMDPIPKGQDYAIEVAFSAWVKPKPIKSFNEDFQKIGRALRKVEPIYESNFRDVAKTLRRIADEIEQGVFGEINNAALVLLSDKIDAFHMGQGQALEAYVLFDMGKEFLRGAILDGMKAR